MAICNSFLKESDDELVAAAQRGDFSGIKSCSPEIQAQIERNMPAVREALNERLGVMAEARVEKHIERGAEKEFEGELTPEKAESLFTKEYNEWRQEVRSQIPTFRYFEQEPPEITKDGKIQKTMAFLFPDKATGRGGVGFYKQTPSEAKRNITHEFVEMDYKLMPKREKEQFEKEIWPTTNKTKEIEFFDKWGKGYGEYAVSEGSKEEPESQQNYCFWMTAFRCETRERLQELKGINPAKFNFCKERDKADERERLLEKLRKGGGTSF